MANIVEKHIFFLDDEPTVREVVRETLEYSRFKVSCFSNPIECLARLRSNKCDLLITDLKMPEKDGIELLADVKRLAPWVPTTVSPRPYSRRTLLCIPGSKLQSPMQWQDASYPFHCCQSAERFHDDR